MCFEETNRLSHDVTKQQREKTYTGLYTQIQAAFQYKTRGAVELRYFPSMGPKKDRWKKQQITSTKNPLLTEKISTDNV